MSKTYKKFGNKNFDRRFEKRRKIVQQKKLDKKMFGEDKTGKSIDPNDDTFLDDDYDESNYQNE